jgi:hypothetical protein
MWFNFRNGYSRRLWVVVGYFSPGCQEGDDWSKVGWYQLDPGGMAIVLWTTNSFTYFYAEADDGTVWAGPFATQVPLSAFDWCWNTGSTASVTVGMREMHSTNPGLPWISTINLV